MKHSLKLAMILLIVLCPISGLVADDHPRVEGYEPQPGDDEMVEVTVGQMRIANYVYELYIVAEEETEGWRTLYNESQKSLRERATDLIDIAQQNISLEEQTRQQLLSLLGSSSHRPSASLLLLLVDDDEEDTMPNGLSDLPRFRDQLVGH